MDSRPTVELCMNHRPPPRHRAGYRRLAIGYFGSWSQCALKRGGSSPSSFLRSLWIMAVLAQLCNIAESANLLVNPGFELDPPGQTQTLLSWQKYGPNNYSE